MPVPAGPERDINFTHSLTELIQPFLYDPEKPVGTGLDAFKRLVRHRVDELVVDDISGIYRQYPSALLRAFAEDRNAPVETVAYILNGGDIGEYTITNPDQHPDCIGFRVALHMAVVNEIARLEKTIFSRETMTTRSDTDAKTKATLNEFDKQRLDLLKSTKAKIEAKVTSDVNEGPPHSSYESPKSNF